MRPVSKQWFSKRTFSLKTGVDELNANFVICPLLPIPGKCPILSTLRPDGSLVCLSCTPFMCHAEVMTPETISQAVLTTKALNPHPPQNPLTFLCSSITTSCSESVADGMGGIKAICIKFFYFNWLFAYPCLALKEWEMAQR